MEQWPYLLGAEYIFEAPVDVTRVIVSMSSILWFYTNGHLDTST